MSIDELVPREPPGGERSALSDLLSRSVIYERAGGVIPHDLLQFGFFGSLVVIVTGLLAVVFPDATSIRAGDFFLVLGGTAADLSSLLHALAIPAILGGFALLLLDIYLMDVPRSERWRGAVVAQAVAGGLGGVLGTLFLALLIFNLAIWIAIIAVGLAIVLGVLGAAAGS